MLQARRLILTSCIHAPLQRNFLQVCTANCRLQHPCTPVIRFCSTDAANSVTAVPPAAHKHNTSKRRKFKKNKQKTVVSAASATPDQAKDNADESIKTADKVAEKTNKVAESANKVAEDVTILKPLAPKVKLPQKQRKITTKKEVEEKILAGVVRKDSKVTTVTAIATQSPKKDKQDKSSPVQIATTVATQSFKKDKQDKNSSIQAATETALVCASKSTDLPSINTETITTTLQEIASLQKTLPSETAIASLITKLRQVSFQDAHELFDLYRNYGNPYLDENFLTPGVLACCEEKKPTEGLDIVRDMLDQGRKVDESTLRTLFDACEKASAAIEVIELWHLMEKAGMKLQLTDYNRFLNICYQQEYLDGAIQVLKQLRLLRSVSVHTYMHWLLRASIVWRSDAFFDLLMEMRLSQVEPEIMSLTSLESGRKDRALTVMEGVRAVGLDPCFAMASVFSSMQASVYQNGPSYQALTAQDLQHAREKFNGLTPIELEWPVSPTPQVLETQAAGLLLERETFRRLKRQQVNHIDKLLEMLPITTNMTINLRKQLLRMSLLVNTHRVRRDRIQICKEYDSGRSLIELSTIHNYPPVSLMRVILRAKGKSQLEIKESLARPSLNLSKRDQRELRRATEYDSIHKSDPLIEAPQYDAASLERAIEHYLKAAGIRLKTQSELSADQAVTHGRTVISPDILFLDPVIINGVPIRWIDAKNYYGAHIVSKRLISTQLSNYVKEWGPGAIVFGMGFSDMFSLPGVMCLDTTPLPTSRTEAAKVRLKSFFHSCLNVFRWRKHLGSELTQYYRPAKPSEK